VIHKQHVGARPGGWYDMRPSGIITDIYHKHLAITLMIWIHYV